MVIKQPSLHGGVIGNVVNEGLVIEEYLMFVKLRYRFILRHGALSAYRIKKLVKIAQAHHPSNSRTGKAKTQIGVAG